MVSPRRKRREIRSPGGQPVLPAKRDYYSILQVNPAASQEAIDAAYARLSRIYDPAVSRKRKAAERRAEIDEAYEVLSDKKRRAEYDRLRARGWRPGQPLKEERAPSGIMAWLGNPSVFAGLVGSGVLLILGGIILFSVLDSGETSSVSNPSPSALAPATPTVPAQQAGTAPESPPEVTGEPVTMESGLQYIDIVVGTGEGPNPGDTVVVNYTGWLQDGGKKFDSSLERTVPFTFPLGQGRVIKGWDEGVASMKVGGKRRLIIPPELGYGEAGSPPNIPGNATLIFDIEMLDVFHVGETAAPTPPPPGVPESPAASPAESPAASP